ncbi:hypothetical protein DCM91_18670 [Chitinophaga costaii]|nr:hypothetical protein DCM91_18670 [Chitinophaga costaii]
MASSMILLVLAGGAVAWMIWSLRKKNSTQYDADLAEEHLKHTGQDSGWSRWGQHQYTSPAGGLGAASH